MPISTWLTNGVTPQMWAVPNQYPCRWTHTVDFEKQISPQILRYSSFLFTTYPFWYLGEDEVLIFQMIGFVEGLLAEWESKWKLMQMRCSPDLEVEEGKQIDNLCNMCLITFKDREMSYIIWLELACGIGLFVKRDRWGTTVKSRSIRAAEVSQGWSIL